MTTFEMLMIFWALPSLVTLLLLINAFKSFGLDGIWSGVVFASIFWPIGLILIVLGKLGAYDDATRH